MFLLSFCQFFTNECIINVVVLEANVMKKASLNVSDMSKSARGHCRGLSWHGIRYPVS